MVNYTELFKEWNLTDDKAYVLFSIPHKYYEDMLIGEYGDKDFRAAVERLKEYISKLENVTAKEYINMRVRGRKKMVNEIIEHINKIKGDKVVTSKHWERIYGSGNYKKWSKPLLNNVDFKFANKHKRILSMTSKDVDNVFKKIKEERQLPKKKKPKKKQINTKDEVNLAVGTTSFDEFKVMNLPCVSKNGLTYYRYKGKLKLQHEIIKDIQLERSRAKVNKYNL